MLKHGGGVQVLEAGASERGTSGSFDLHHFHNKTTRNQRFLIQLTFPAEHLWPADCIDAAGAFDCPLGTVRVLERTSASYHNVTRYDTQQPDRSMIHARPGLGGFNAGLCSQSGPFAHQLDRSSFSRQDRLALPHQRYPRPCTSPQCCGREPPTPMQKRESKV